ncbi:MAG: 50S ribosomal protein L10 [Deltaproteobacteria bacterium]|nr:50S ribosomal protein L10 [Deltaproteobacteria bacterium]
MSKPDTVEALKSAIAAQRGAVVTSFRGVTVSEMTALRKKLREANAEIRVVKNTLVRRAAEGTPFGALSENFKGPTAIAFSHGDPVALAKAMKEYAAASPKITLKAGFFDGKVLSAKDVQALADVPSREVLLSRLVGGMIYPITRLAQVLADGPRGLACVMESIRKQMPEEAAAGETTN